MGGKIYEAQVYNYGKRMLFDFIILERAAFLTFAMMNIAKACRSSIPFTINLIRHRRRQL